MIEWKDNGLHRVEMCNTCPMFGYSEKCENPGTQKGHIRCESHRKVKI